MLAVAFVTVTGMKEIVLDLAEVAKTAEIENQLCDFGVAGLLAAGSHDPLIATQLRERSITLSTKVGPGPRRTLTRGIAVIDQEQRGHADTDVQEKY